MPRPPKHVPPDTLGGRIRAARAQLRFSLAHVAANRYSTSLISQIERNRVEPSYESLQFLADQLQLPFDELLELSQQNKESEAEARQYKIYDELTRRVRSPTCQPSCQRGTSSITIVEHVPNDVITALAACRIAWTMLLHAATVSERPEGFSVCCNRETCTRTC